MTFTQLGAMCLLASSEGTPNPMEWKTDLALWTAVVFISLLAILWKLAWRPIADGLDKRERNVSDQIAQAESANAKAKDILADYERKLAAAQDDVRAIVERGRRDAEQLGRQLIEKSKEQAEAEYDRALQHIDAATAAAIKDLARQSATMAVDLAGKILREKLNAKDHSRLIDQAVAGFVAGDKEVSRN